MTPPRSYMATYCDECRRNLATLTVSFVWANTDMEEDRDLCQKCMKEVRRWEDQGYVFVEDVVGLTRTES